MFRIEAAERTQLSNNTTVGELPKPRIRDAAATTAEAAQKNTLPAGGLSTPTYLDAQDHLPAYTGSADGDGVNIMGKPRFAGMVFEPPTRGGKWSEADGWGAGMVGGRFVPKPAAETSTAPVGEQRVKLVKDGGDRSEHGTTHPEPTRPAVGREHVLLRRPPQTAARR